MVHIFGVERSIDVPAENFPTAVELSELESQDVMPNCEHGWYESCYDGVKLHYRYFQPSSKPPKAVLIFQHGICTHGGKALMLKSSGRKLNMSLLSETCLKEDFAVYAPDMYGHGYSEGTRFLIPETWKNNLNDLLAFVDIVSSQNEGVPLFLMGESYGGSLTIHAAKFYQENPDKTPKYFHGILLTGPAIQADLPPYPVYLFLRYVLAPLFPRWTPFFMPNPVSPDRVWRDPEVLAFWTKSRSVELLIDGSGRPFRLGTALNLVSAMEECRSIAIPGLKQPFCVAHGVDDAGVPVAGTDYLVKTANTPDDDKEYLRLGGAYHDLLADPTAEETMSFFMTWMKKQISKNIA